MNTYTPEQLRDILALHRKWRDGLVDGKRANLSGADLSRAYLSDANLSRANLSRADLSRAYLSDANLSGANLSGAYLSRANLPRADLSGANLFGADLSGANLFGADLSDAYLSDANLSGAKTDEKTRLPAFLIVPQMGAFIAWKKASGKVLRLEVPADAHRVSSPVGRKCRAEFVRVLDIDGDTTVGASVRGDHDRNTIYTVGEITRADEYDDDWRVECTHGIHFFITREEAAEYE